MSIPTILGRPCIKCGHQTSSKRGLCRKCKNGEQLPDPSKLETERIIQYLATLELELMRRRSEIEEVLSRRAASAAPLSPAKGPEADDGVPASSGPSRAQEAA